MYTLTLTQKYTDKTEPITKPTVSKIIAALYAELLSGKNIPKIPYFN
jgi:hypothetical protein